jgi:hypothetical protein
MKVYILPVNKKFQPSPHKISFPPHSKGYMMETDFYDWITKQDFLTNDPNEADWHYLPIFWNFWKLDHNFAKAGEDELEAEVERVVVDSGKTFTITQYDGGVNYNGVVDFAASKLGRHGIPIPILTLPHKLPDKLPEKKWLTSFVGKLYTHSSRQEMAERLKPWRNVNIVESKKGEELFVNSILESYCTLCPRGSAMGSFRFYESMQLGVVPLMLSDADVRPFPNYINWKECSLFTYKPKNLPYMLKRLSPERALEMGRNAKKVWEEQLANQNWCKYVLMTLEDPLNHERIRLQAEENKVSGKDVHDDFDQMVIKNGYKTGVEIGVWYGNHAERLLELTGGQVYGIDPYWEKIQTSIKDFSQIEWNAMYRYAIKRLSKYPGYTHIRKDSSKAMSDVPDSVDYVYIDGDHSYEGCLADIQKWFPKVRKGGLVGGDDYGHPHLKGVKKAVDEYFEGNQRVFRDGVWLIQK